MTLLYIILGTASVSIISFIGIVTLSKKVELNGHRLKLLISLAAGSLLAVAFLDLLPEAVEAHPEPHTIFGVALVSFLLFFILEKFFHWHHCRCLDHQHKHEQENAKKSVVYTNIVGDAVHNFIDGILIATAFLIDPYLGVITTVAVLLHEVPQEISDFGVLVYGGLTRKKALWWNFVFALTAVAGGIIFYYIGQSFSEIIPFLAAFSAGNFLYLAAADLIPELHHEKDSKHVVTQTAMLLLGVALILGANKVLPHSHGHEDGAHSDVHTEEAHDGHFH